MTFFFCLKLRVSIWRTGRHIPTKNSLEYPPGGEAEEFMCFASPTQSSITVSLVFICCLVYSTDIRTSSWLQSSSKLVPVLKNFTYRWFSLSSTTVVMISRFSWCDRKEDLHHTFFAIVVVYALLQLFFTHLHTNYKQQNKKRYKSHKTIVNLIHEKKRIGEVTCGWSPQLSCKCDQIKMRDYMDRRVTPPKQVTSPTWGAPPPCKQPLTETVFIITRKEG